MKDKYKKKKKVNPRSLLVMDDCLASKGDWAKDAKIHELFFNGRHYQITYILTMQFPLGIKPELRFNFDYVFIMAEDFFNNKKRIFDHYAGMFPNFRSFKAVFDEITKDFGCMVIVNRGSRKNLLDKIFWFKAKNHKNMEVFGTKQFKDYHKKNYNGGDQSSSKLGIEEYLETKQKGGLVVKKTK